MYLVLTLFFPKRIFYYFQVLHPDLEIADNAFPPPRTAPSNLKLLVRHHHSSKQCLHPLPLAMSHCNRWSLFPEHHVFVI